MSDSNLNPIEWFIYKWFPGYKGDQDLFMENLEAALKYAAESAQPQTTNDCPAQEGADAGTAPDDLGLTESDLIRGDN